MLRHSIVFIPYVMWFLYIAWIIAAVNDNMFTVGDMRNKGRRFQKGIPITGHWAMLYLDLVLPLLVGYLIQKYGTWWSDLQLVLMLGLGFVLSGVMHWTYIAGGMKFPEAPTYDGRLTPVGWLHFIYMALALAGIGLFYLCTPKPDAFDVWLATIWLVVHITIGVHVPLKLLKPSWFPYHGAMNVDTLGPIAGAAVVLLGFSMYALR